MTWITEVIAETLFETVTEIAHRKGGWIGIVVILMAIAALIGFVWFLFR